MEDYDYNRWVKYIETIFDHCDIEPDTIVDIACGTGSFTTRLAKKGYNIMGIDSSEDMLYVAKEKSLKMGLSIPFIHQDIRSLSLHRPVDAVICMCDGFNYILSDHELVSAFQNVYKFLNDGGLFIFDISSYYKLENILGDNLMADASEEISLIWFNTFDTEDSICCMDLTFFVREDDRYIRFDETHYQRAYKLRDVKNMLEETGFSNIRVYNPFTFELPQLGDQRWVFVADK